MTPEGTDEFNTDITYCRRDSTYGKYVMVYQKGEGYIDGVLWREQGINLINKKDVKIEEITVVDTLRAGATSP